MRIDLLHESSFSKVWSDIRAKASQQVETVAKLVVFTKFLPKRKSQDANRDMTLWLAVRTESCTSISPTSMRNDDP